MAKDPREYGFEGEMAMSQLKGIMQHAKQLHDMLEPDTDLPEWVQSKITLAYDYMQTAADYMATEMSEETQIDELSKDTMKSYKGKAFNQYINATVSPKYADHTSKEYNLADKRSRGMSMANKKLAKEEAVEESKEFYADAKKRAKAGKPQEKLSPSWKAKAKARASAAGREYPNLVDNVWAARMQEEAPANAAGGGNIAGMGVGPDGEPPVFPKAMAKYKRKNKEEEPTAGRKSFSVFMKGK
jgi:hypothetical protein